MVEGHEGGKQFTFFTNRKQREKGGAKDKNKSSWVIPPLAHHQPSAIC